jgi:aerobic-type carbon monoxide dehydrogenase small subunit (CoxS/CutS family)
MTVIALAESQFDCSDEAMLREELAGVICRCTGYVGIVAAAAEYLNTSRGVQQ